MHLLLFSPPFCLSSPRHSGPGCTLSPPLCPSQVMKALRPQLHELPPPGQARAVRAAVTLLSLSLGRRRIVAGLRSPRRGNGKLAVGRRSGLGKTTEDGSEEPLISASRGRSAVRQAVLLSHAVLTSAAVRLKRPALTPSRSTASAAEEGKTLPLSELGFGGRGAASVLWAAASAASLYRRCTATLSLYRAAAPVRLPIKAAGPQGGRRRASFAAPGNQAAAGGRQKIMRWRKGIWQPLLRGIRGPPPWAVSAPGRLPSSSGTTIHRPSLLTRRLASSAAKNVEAHQSATRSSTAQRPGQQKEEEEELEEEEEARSVAASLSYSPSQRSSNSRMMGHGSSPNESTPPQGGDGYWVLEPWLLELQAGLAQLPPRQMAMALAALPRLMLPPPKQRLRQHRSHSQGPLRAVVTVADQRVAAVGKEGSVESAAQVPRLLPPGMMRSLLLRYVWEVWGGTCAAGGGCSRGRGLLLRYVWEDKGGGLLLMYQYVMSRGGWDGMRPWWWGERLG